MPISNFFEKKILPISAVKLINLFSLSFEKNINPFVYRRKLHLIVESNISKK